MPNKWFGMVEEKCGIIFASAPAVRQFFAHRARTGTFSPSKRQYGQNEDFNKMRRRIIFRDIFWFRPNACAGPTQSDDQRSGSKQARVSADIEATAKTSVLDTWWGRLRHAIRRSSTHGNSSQDTGRLKENKRPPTYSTVERGRIERKYRMWGLLPHRTPENNNGSAISAPFLFTNSRKSATAPDQHSHPGQDKSLGETLADPVRSLVSAEAEMPPTETGFSHSEPPQ